MLEIKRKLTFFSFLTFSTAITCFRIMLIPFILINMLSLQWGIACFLFSLAAISDILDGFIARFFQEETFLGACLDPIADKLLLVSCYGMLAFIDSPLFRIPHWFVYLFMIKELMLTIGVLYASLIKKAVMIKPTLLGKFTTFIQILFIWFLFGCAFMHWLPIKTFYTCLYGITFLMFITLFHYLSIGYRGLRYEN